MSAKTVKDSLSNLKVGFIGTGTMGAPMAQRLVSAGLKPLIHDMNKTSAEHLIAEGGIWADSLEQIAKQAEIIFLSLPGPPQVESVISGPKGLIHSMKAGSIIVDLSTNSVSMVRKLANACSEKGIQFLDSPVSGGSKGSTEGSLVLMVGGDKNVLSRVRPILDILSRRIIHLGEVGSGTVAKLINNQLYLCGEVLFYEGLALASKAGLELSSLLEILDMSGAGGIHSKIAYRVIERRFDDNTFALDLAEKDVALSLEAGQTLQVPMPATEAAHKLFAEAKATGLGRKNFWSAIEIVEQRSNTRLKNPKEE